MELKHSDYRTVSKLSLLPPEALRAVDNALKKHTGITLQDIAHRNFKAVLKDNRLLSFVSFSLNGKKCVVHFIWGSAAQRDFIKNYEVTPAQYLMEDFIRRGTRVFKFLELYEKGARMFERMGTKRISEFEDLTLRKLLNFSLQDLYTREIAGSKLVALANSRKTLREGGINMRMKRNLPSDYKPPRRLTKRRLTRKLLK